MDSVLWGALAVLLLAVTMVFQAIRGVLIRKRVYLPAVVYLISVVNMVPVYGLSDTLIAAICSSLMLFAIDVAIVKQHSNAPLFFVGATTLMALFFLPKLLILLPWGLLVLAQIARFSLKDISALFVGWITSFIFIFTSIYIFGDICVAWNGWLDKLSYIQAGGIGSTTRWLQLAFSFILTLIMIISSVTKYVPQIYTARRSISVYISMLVIVTLLSMFLGGISDDIIYITALPMAWIASYYYTSSEGIFSKVVFISYIILSLFIG